MDNASQKLLEAATHRTLHAAGFSRSSSQATLVLTDLLSRYLTLLTSTCSKYGQHSGRTMLSSLDALSALDELGVSLDELKDFGATEGLELNRYSLRSTRRVEDLAEFRAQLSEGLKQDEDDVIPLHYAPFDGPEDIQDEDEDEAANGWEEGAPVDEDDLYADMDVSLDDARRPVAPMLPLSPISNPASPPTRKRRRLSDWQPPPHVPDFLPPFPTMEDAPSPTGPLPEPVAPMENNRPPSPTQPAVPAQALTSSAGADWHLQVPYHQSSLSSLPEFHLPAPLPAHLPRQPKLPTPATEPALIAAYHHILTHRQETTAIPGNGNPQRHKVAMSLLSLVQSSSRWEPSDTLYSNLTTNQPRVTAMGPSHPIALGDTHGAQLTKEKDFKFPAVTSRSVIASEHLTNVVAEQSSRIPDLAQQVLPLKIYNRTSRLAPPPVLIADNKPLTYGNGIPAPWNIGPTPPTVEGKKTDNPRVLPDARLFATWDSETKSFKEPLKGRGSRGKAVIHSSRRTGRNA